jgi:hypothetical protein
MDPREPYEVRIVEDRWATLRHIVEAVAILAAGIWAFYTFVYQEKIKPANEPAALNLTLEVSSLGHDSDRDYVNLTYTMRNTGKTEIDIAADAYNIWGERFGPGLVVRGRVLPASRKYDNDIPIVLRRLVASQVELRAMAVGGTHSMHAIIEPGASETVARVFAVPRRAYDLFHAQVFVVPVKTSMSAPVPVAIVAEPTGGYSINPKPPIFEDDNTADFVLPH